MSVFEHQLRPCWNYTNHCTTIIITVTAIATASKCNHWSFFYYVISSEFGMVYQRIPQGMFSVAKYQHSMSYIDAHFNSYNRSSKEARETVDHLLGLRGVCHMDLKLTNSSLILGLRCD